MEYLFKKYLWVLHLGLVVALGAYLGSSISDYAGQRYLKVPFFATEGLDERVHAVQVAEGTDEERKAPSVDELKQRNAFNVDRFLEDDLPAEEEKSGEEEGPLDVGDSDKLTEADVGGAQLAVTMVARDPDESLALVKDGASMKMMRVGMKVADKATILAIRPKYLVVKVDTKVQVMKLGGSGGAADKGKGGTTVPGLRPPTPAAGDEASAAGGPDGGAPSQYDAWVKRTGANEYQIDRANLMNELNDLTKLGMQARVVPNYKGGKYEGFKLIGVRPNSLYRAIGIRSGDVVKSVNGAELNSPNKAITLFEELKNQSKITVDVERGGRSMQLLYQVK